MRYVEARLIEKTHALAYRIYVTDVLQCIANEISTLFSKGGDKVVPKRYYSVYKEMKEPTKTETRTSEEIISDISEKLANFKG